MAHDLYFEGERVVEEIKFFLVKRTDAERANIDQPWLAEFIGSDFHYLRIQELQDTIERNCPKDQKKEALYFPVYRDIQSTLNRYQHIQEVNELPNRNPAELSRMFKSFKRLHFNFRLGIILGVYRISFLTNFFQCWVTIHEFLSQDALTQVNRDPIRIVNVFTFLWPICSFLYDSLLARKKHRRLRPKMVRIKLISVAFLLLLLIALLISFYRLDSEQIDISPILNQEEIQRQLDDFKSNKHLPESFAYQNLTTEHGQEFNSTQPVID